MKPIQAPADFVSVNGVLGQLQSAQMTALKDRPEDLKDLKQYGLDKPAVVATIGTGASSVKFELGKEADTGSVWGRDPSKAAVFSINNGVAMELKKTVDDFRRKEVFDFRPVQHHAIRDYARQRYARVRAGQGHRRERGRHMEAGRACGEDRGFQQLRRCAARFLEPSRRELRRPPPAPPPATTTRPRSSSVKFDDGKKEERVVIRHRRARACSPRAPISRAR